MVTFQFIPTQTSTQTLLASLLIASEQEATGNPAVAAFACSSAHL